MGSTGATWERYAGGKDHGAQTTEAVTSANSGILLVSFITESPYVKCSAHGKLSKNIC